MWFLLNLHPLAPFIICIPKNIDVEEQNRISKGHKLQYLPLIFHKLRIPFFLAWIASTKK